MRLFQFSGIFIVLLMVFSNCDNKSENLAIQEGTYDGVFTVAYENQEPISNEVTLSFSNGKYSSSAGPNRIPAGGEGTYSITKDSITFNDQNIWTADFDWGLILNGVYKLNVDGNSIELIKNQKSSDGFYKYELSKK